MTAQQRAFKAISDANTCIARHLRSRPKAHEARLLVGYALALENQRTKDCHYTRAQLRTLRGKSA